LVPALDVEDRHERYRRAILLVSFLACFALQAATGAGQTVGAMTGAINGTVTDRTSAALPGVAIAISSAALMGTRTPVTNREGLYRFRHSRRESTRSYSRWTDSRQSGAKGFMSAFFTATVNVELQIASLQDNSLRQAEFPAKSREARVTAYAVEPRLDAEKDQPRASFFAGPLQPL
jgi:hypothetical protein